MARQSKTTTTKIADETTNAAAPVVQVAPVVADATPKVKKVAAPKAKKETSVAAVVAAPVVSTPVVASSSTEETVPVVADAESPLSEQSAEFFAKLQQLGTVISALKTEYRTLEKRWSRELKSSQKQCSKRKRKSGNRAPSGFVKPTRISDELATFLGKTSGSEMARTEVTRDINQYIRANSLQDKENGRKINPDTKLAGLLKIKKGEELTYFNLQRYMSPHFAKSDKSVAAAAAASAALSTA
jgi:chromatin remodeling complex protein RSC6